MKFSYQTWLVLIGTLISNAAYWMSWPFLAVILNQHYGMSPGNIGAIFSSSVIVSTIIGIYMGYLSDKIGYEWMMMTGCLFGVAGFLLLGLCNAITILMIAIFLVSMSKATLDPVSKALITDLSSTTGMREKVLHARYFLVNLGAAVGPLSGYYLNIAASKIAFTITASTFAIYLLLLMPLLRANQSGANSQDKKKKFNFKYSLQVTCKDHAFLVMVIMNIMLWIVFTQFETTLALYLSVGKANDITKIIGYVFFTNTVTILILQFPLLSLISKFTLSRKIYFGLLILFISQLMFASAGVNNKVGLMLATFVFSIGEVILVPTLNVAVDNIAKSHLRSSYFAVSSLYRLGCGAYLGSLLLQYYGGAGLYVAMAMICCFMAVIYSVAEKMTSRNLKVSFQI